MTPEQLIRKYREEFYRFFEYAPPVQEIIEDIKYNATHQAKRMLYINKQIEELELKLIRARAEYEEIKKNYETHLKALDILRSEHK